MNDYQDFELISMICENSEEASDILYEKYNYIVDIIFNKYKRNAILLGIDLKDLKQEALVGFSDALVNYNQDNGSSLSTFISLCVRRRVRNFIRYSDTQKSKATKETYSLDYKVGDADVTLKEIIGDPRLDPQVEVEDRENVDTLKKKIDEILSPNEKEVYELMINSFTCEEISSILDINQKKVYNSIARIRMKIKKIL